MPEASITCGKLQVGMYDVRAELAGFQSSIRAGIQLTVGQEAAINITLSVGAVTESVTITGEAPVVETTTSSLSQLVDDPTDPRFALKWPRLYPARSAANRHEPGDELPR